VKSGAVIDSDPMHRDFFIVAHPDPSAALKKQKEIMEQLLPLIQTNHFLPILLNNHAPDRIYR
jgi:hypothetical protein